MGDLRHKSSHSGTSGTPPSKPCASCGREITWRKKWERDWDKVRFCSDKCRRNKPGEQDAALEEAIRSLLHQRGAGKTICPSEAARMVAGEGSLSEDRSQWEPLMEPARAAARRLVANGEIVMMQGGVVVDPSHAKGPVRLRFRQS